MGIRARAHHHDVALIGPAALVAHALAALVLAALATRLEAWLARATAAVAAVRRWLAPRAAAPTGYGRAAVTSRRAPRLSLRSRPRPDRRRAPASERRDESRGDSPRHWPRHPASRRSVSPADASVVVVSLKRPGPKKQAGSYRVAWRVTGPDGHAVSGIIPFRVRR